MSVGSAAARRLRPYRCQKKTVTTHREQGAPPRPVCPACSGPLDDRQRCWGCCQRVCRCGQATGSAFLATCVLCDLGDDLGAKRWLMTASSDNGQPSAPYVWADCWCPRCRRRHRDLVSFDRRKTARPVRQICDGCYLPSLNSAARITYLQRKEAVSPPDVRRKAPPSPVQGLLPFVTDSESPPQGRPGADEEAVRRRSRG